MTEPDRYATLWGGPMDGATVWLPRGDLPARVGMHATGDGRLVVIRGLAIMAAHPEHVQVYERATISVLQSYARALHARVSVDGAAGLETHPLYVHRELVTRWAAL